MKQDRFYLIYIKECIARVEEYTANGKDAFLASHLIQDGVLRNLHTLSESTQRLSSRLKDTYPHVPWADIARFRNVLVHDYLSIDLEQIWDNINIDLPPFKEQINKILTDLGHS
ncbi:MAG: DUF86 domain-containing protein [Deltaproteobacteria bacterium]|nr:DUF86 domain-containing protein [Deltaproteobacteria bacterium]